MEQRTIMQEVMKTSREWRRYMKKIALEAGIPDSYRQVLMFLRRHPGESQKQLAEFCQCTPAAISQIIREMILSGYIKKETDENDLRYVHLYLTDKGEKNAQEIHKRAREASALVTEAIGLENEETLILMLQKLSKAIRKECNTDD